MKIISQIILITFILLSINLSWSSPCYDGDENCGTCCFSTFQCWLPDYDPNREGCADVCEQGNNSLSCNQRAAPINGPGAICNTGLSTHLPWHSDAGLSCGLYTEEACCINGFLLDSGSNSPTFGQFTPSSEYSCNENTISNSINCNADDCEDYTAGLEEGCLLCAQSGDANGDGALDILDIVYFIDIILNP